MKRFDRLMWLTLAVVMLLAFSSCVWAATSVQETWIRVYDPTLKSYRAIAKGELIGAQKARTLNVSGTSTLAGKATFGNAATAGILHGAGATNQAGAYSIGSGGGKAMSYYITSTSATTTHALEGLYVRTYHGASATAAAPMGEAIRGFATVTGDAAGGTITGLHASASLGTGGTNSGLTVGSRSNLMFPNEVIANYGTFAGAQVELNTGGAATDVSGTTSTSLLRLIIDGTAPTAAAQFTVPIFDIVLPANLVADDVIMDTAASDNTVGAKLRIRVNGTTYWLMLADASN